MPRNIEIKAKISQLETVLEKAQVLVGNIPILIEQKDIFFHSENGRLKLRFLSASRGELIFYQRDNISGPKTSTYHVVETDQPNELRALLSAAYGEKIIVRKQR
ncbi:MAG: class IV adenylate cyclase, partial [Hyphomicrobiales bacterium]